MHKHSNLLFLEILGAMGLHNMLMLLCKSHAWISALLSVASALAVAYQSALPNCLNSCGGVEIQIPYPFGMTQTQRCYLP